MALAPRLLPESRAPGAGRIDLVGAALVSLGLVAIVLPLVEGQQQGWPAWVFVCLALRSRCWGRSPCTSAGSRAATAPR